MIPWERLKLWFGHPLQNGVWPDVSKHDNDGIITGGYWTEDSIEFDGVDDLVNCGHDSSLDITQEITLETLFKPYSHGVGSYGRVLEKTQSFFIYLGGYDRVSMRLYDSGDVNHDTYTPNYFMVYGEWCHVVGTYNGTIQKIYFNGELSHSTSSWSDTIKSSAANDLCVANRSNGTQAFDGKIALVRVYDKAFTVAQVVEAYQQCYRLI